MGSLKRLIGFVVAAAITMAGKLLKWKPKPFQLPKRVEKEQSFSIFLASGRGPPVGTLAAGNSPVATPLLGGCGDRQNDPSHEEGKKMAEIRSDCPCKRIKCERFGNCDACRQHHQGSKHGPACDRLQEKEERKKRKSGGL